MNRPLALTGVCSVEFAVNLWRTKPGEQYLEEPSVQPPPSPKDFLPPSPSAEKAIARQVDPKDRIFSQASCTSPFWEVKVCATRNYALTISRSNISARIKKFGSPACDHDTRRSWLLVRVWWPTSPVTASALCCYCQIATSVLHKLHSVVARTSSSSLPARCVVSRALLRRPA